MRRGITIETVTVVDCSCENGAIVPPRAPQIAAGWAAAAGLLLAWLTGLLAVVSGVGGGGLICIRDHCSYSSSSLDWRGVSLELEESEERRAFWSVDVGVWVEH